MRDRWIEIEGTARLEVELHLSESRFIGKLYDVELLIKVINFMILIKENFQHNLRGFIDSCILNALSFIKHLNRCRQLNS